MPLLAGANPPSIQENIRLLMSQGKSEDEAIATAYAMARRPGLPVAAPLTSRDRVILPSEVAITRAQRLHPDQPGVATPPPPVPLPARIREAIKNFNTVMNGPKE